MKKERYGRNDASHLPGAGIEETVFHEPGAGPYPSRRAMSALRQRDEAQPAGLRAASSDAPRMARSSDRAKALIHISTYLDLKDLAK